MCTSLLQPPHYFYIQPMFWSRKKAGPTHDSEHYKQARKSSEDAQAAGYARFEKVLGQVRFGSKMFRLKILAFLHTFVLISGNPTKTQNISVNFLTESDDLKKKYFGFW